MKLEKREIVSNWQKGFEYFLGNSVVVSIMSYKASWEGAVWRQPEINWSTIGAQSDPELVLAFADALNDAVVELERLNKWVDEKNTELKNIKKEVLQ